MNRVYGRCGGCLQLKPAALEAFYIDQIKGTYIPYTVCQTCEEKLRRDGVKFAQHIAHNLQMFSAPAKGKGSP